MTRRELPAKGKAGLDCLPDGGVVELVPGGPSHFPAGGSFTGLEGDYSAWSEELSQRRRCEPPCGAPRPDWLRVFTSVFTSEGGTREKDWRRRPDLNRGWRFCRPLPYHLATAPL